MEHGLSTYAVGFPTDVVERLGADWRLCARLQSDGNSFKIIEL